MRIVPGIAVLLMLASGLSGCVAVDVATTAAGVATTAVSTAADVGSTVVSTTAHTVAGGSSDDGKSD